MPRLSAEVLPSPLYRNIHTSGVGSFTVVELTPDLYSPDIGIEGKLLSEEGHSPYLN